jgi:hypothetical protein
MPSGEVITRSPVPLSATATNNPLPYVTEFHTLFAALVWLVHVIPAWSALAAPAPITMPVISIIDTETKDNNRLIRIDTINFPPLAA